MVGGLRPTQDRDALEGGHGSQGGYGGFEKRSTLHKEGSGFHALDGESAPELVDRLPRAYGNPPRSPFYSVMLTGRPSSIATVGILSLCCSTPGRLLALSV